MSLIFWIVQIPFAYSSTHANQKWVHSTSMLWVPRLLKWMVSSLIRWHLHTLITPSNTPNKYCGCEPPTASPEHPIWNNLSFTPSASRHILCFKSPTTQIVKSSTTPSLRLGQNLTGWSTLSSHVIPALNPTTPFAITPSFEISNHPNRQTTCLKTSTPPLPVCVHLEQVDSVIESIHPNLTSFANMTTTPSHPTFPLMCTCKNSEFQHHSLLCVPVGWVA